MTPEEIKKALAEVASDPSHRDRVRALEALARIEGLVQHGNKEKKDWREVVVVRREKKKGDQEMRAV